MQINDIVNNEIGNLVTTITNNLRLHGAAKHWHSMDNADCFLIAPTGIVASGIIEKFEKPNDANSENRRLSAVIKYVREDHEMVCNKHQFVNDSDSAVLSSCSDFISKTFRGMRFSFDDCWFGPGECYDSHKGRTSFLSKLNQLPFTVTDNAADMGFELLWSNRQIRRWMTSEFLQVTPKTFDDFQSQLNEIKKTVLQRVPGNRLETVPKNNEKDRDIGIEPKLNLMLQKGIGAAIRRGLMINHGYDLNHGQQKHADMIKSRDMATIDLSSASNLLSLELVRTVVPKYWVRMIEDFRSPIAEFRDEDKVFRKTLKKVSSMGNGFTFELLTIILMGFARHFDKEASVYGDDIVMSKESAPALIEFLHSVTDFRVNTRKSFTNGFIRESCGAFYVENISVERYDFRWCTNDEEAFVAINKLRRLALLDYLDPSLRTAIISAHRRILERLPGNRGPISTSLHGKWVESPFFEPVFPKLRKYSSFLKNNCYGRKDVAVLYVPFFDDSLTRGGRRTINHCRSTDLRAYSIFLRNSRCPTLYKRGAGEWTMKPALVRVSDGLFLGFLQTLLNP